MARQKNDQIPLGELLLRARLDKGLSRARVAKETGLSENSLVRYEKAGLEKDGQYPPANKLAALCLFLEIPPITSLLGCLEYQDYWKYKQKTRESDIENHPDQQLFMDDYFFVLRRNRFLSFMLKGALKGNQSLPEDEWEELKERTIAIIEEKEALDMATYKDTRMWPDDTHQTPGIPKERRDEAALKNPTGPIMKNGPGEKPEPS